MAAGTVAAPSPANQDARRAGQRKTMAWFTRKNYAAHRSLDPSGLPPTFDEWLSYAGQNIERGHTVARVVIDPVRFAAWCRAELRRPDAAARAAYALLVADAAKRRG